MSRRTRRPRPGAQADPARGAAFDALRMVSSDGAYANLAINEVLGTSQLSERDAAFATELLAGTARLSGTYDAIIERAGARALTTLQPAVVDLLRLGAHQILSMRMPTRAAVAATVELARAKVGERVTGVVNAILRKITAHDMTGWLDQLCAGLSGNAARAVRQHHPRWIVDAYADILPPEELDACLAANNAPASPTLVVRPGLAQVAELEAAGAHATDWSPYGATITGRPGALEAVRQGRAGVQDEGSQLVAAALARAEAPDGLWLDMCAGPGGKSALLAGLARQAGTDIVASEIAPHRAGLVAQGLRAYDPAVAVICADGTRPPWRDATFARVLVDAPCTGLGALRRRPESRWRHRAEDLDDLVVVQRALLGQALDATVPGGVVAYVTCSPHVAETHDVVAEVMRGRHGVDLLDAPALLNAAARQEVEGAARTDPFGGQRFVQLWPHRHGTDAIFMALLRMA